MNTPTRETFSRTLLVDVAGGLTPTEAIERARGYVVQVDVGAAVASSPTWQAALLTVVNTGWRATPGGVHVRLEADGRCALPWARGELLSSVIRRYGGTLVGELGATIPTIALDARERPAGAVVVWPTWEGWSAGVVPDPARRLDERTEMELAGVLMGATAMSEAFQHLQGYPLAGRRELGLSLWRPDVDWRDSTAAGPALQQLPSRLWLAGLGHLGQAYAWALGCLPYTDPSAVKLMLQDFDVVEDANESTGLCTFHGDRNRPKTRVVAGRLEAAGFETSITERRFSRATQPESDEPRVLLAGFDQLGPRRQLDEAGFAHVVDAGLGAGKSHYLDMLIHTFPGEVRSSVAFADRAPIVDVELPPHLQAEVERRVAAGEDRESAQCGVTRLNGASAAAAFVGAAASALTLGDVLRHLHRGLHFEVVAMSLRDGRVQAKPRGESERLGVIPSAVVDRTMLSSAA